MGDVIRPDFAAKLDVPINDIIDSAKETKNFESIVIIGWTKDEGHYFASSTGDVAEMLLLLELAKKRVIDEATAEQ